MKFPPRPTGPAAARPWHAPVLRVGIAFRYCDRGIAPRYRNIGYRFGRDAMHCVSTTPNPNPIPQSQNPAIPIAAPLALLRRSNNYRLDSIAARFQLPRHSNYRPDPITVPIQLSRRSNCRANPTATPDLETQCIASLHGDRRRR